MCSYGFALRHILKTYASNDVTKIKCIKVKIDFLVHEMVLGMGSDLADYEI